MAPSQPTENGRKEPKAHRKEKRGFTVGPANLPDGTYRRKGRQAAGNPLDGDPCFADIPP